MNKILLAIIVLAVIYILFKLFTKVTQLIFRVALVILILGVLGFGVVNVADLIPDKQAVETVSNLVDKIPEQKLPGNELVSNLLPEERSVEVEALNTTNETIIPGNEMQVINGTVNHTLTELGDP